jgi:H+/Cl- antiporter ClcA
MGRLKTYIDQNFHNGELSVLTLLRWLVIGSLTGLVCGVAGAAFALVLEWVNVTRNANSWLIFLLPVAGLFIVWCYQALDMENDSGTNQIIASVRSGEKPRLRLALLIFLGTGLTHLTGGSAGREGAALQIGGSLAATIGKVLHLDERNMNLIVLCGMSALFTALFGTPVAATVFSIEVVSVGIVHYSALFPSLLASFISLGVTRLLGVEGEGWTLMSAPAVSPESLIRTGVLAILCALLSMAFCVIMHRTAALYKRYIPNQYLRVVVGGVIIIALTLLEGSRDYNGAGGQIITLALAGTVRVPWAFLLKIVFTALTLGAGFRGGEIVPTFFIGATFGCAAAPLIGLDPAFGAAVGMISLFCAVVNCPLASILLSVELFGSDALWFFALACALSYLLSGKYSLYSAQKIMYSKFEPRYIDANAH